MICDRGYDFCDIPRYAPAMSRTLAEKIVAIRMALRLDQTQFAELIGTTQSSVSRWGKGAVPGGANLSRIAEVGKTTVERLLDIDGPGSEADIPVVGYVGAGAEVLPFDDYAHGQGFSHIERPPFISGRAVAVEIRGDSLLPVAENGWKLIYTGEQTMLEDEVLNRLCVVALTDGRMLVKKVLRGSEPQRYHLQSTNAPLIENAQIEWAAPVRAIIPE